MKRRLTGIEKELLHEIITEKLSKIKELCGKMYPDIDKNEYSYDK